MKRAEIFFSVLLLPVDFLTLLAGFVLSYYVRDQVTFVSPDDNLAFLAERVRYNPGGVVVLSFDHYLRYLAVIIPAMLVIFAFAGLYAMRSSDSWAKRLGQIFIGVSVGEFFILLLFLLKKDFFIPRGTVLYSWLFCTLFVVLGRLAVQAVQRRLQASGVGTVRLGLVGKNPAAERVAASIQARRDCSYQLAFHVDSLPLDKLQAKVREGLLDELIVASGQYSDDDLASLRNHCLEEHVGFRFLPSLLTALESSFAVDTSLGLPMIEVRPTPLEGWGRVLKRTFDVVGALLLILLFSPFYLLIALWIKLDDPSGPVIYKHPRLGRNNQPFELWKFRSFKWKYCTRVGHSGDRYFAELLEKNPELKKEWQETMKLKDDPRVSRPGRFLRKTHLDELPQFFNVLSGKLSLAGPRPIVQEEVGRFGEKARILFTVKPGVTGPWQVAGGNSLSYDERVTLNTHYIEHWNLWMDIVILFKTAVLLIKRDSGHASY